MNFNRLIDRLLKENWDRDRIKKYIGDYHGSYFAYAQDEDLRKGAASGGVVTALLWHLLRTDQIEGALVCRSRVEGGVVGSEFFIAESLADLKRAQGSKYITTRFSFEALPLIKAFNGTMAVVGLPCDAKRLHLYSQKHPQVGAKIKCLITLFCGHLSTLELTAHIVDKLRPEPDAKLVDFCYRSGHWRGQLTATYQGHDPVVRPFSAFSDYQNLHFFSARKCLHCYDHTGYFSDIAVGDVWLQEMKDHPIKHSGIIAKTERGLDIINAAAANNALILHEKPISEIVESQSRSLKIHYNITARAKAGKLLGENIKDQVHEKVRLVDFLVAFLLMLNHKITEKEWGKKLVFWLPGPLLRLYLYFIKGLEVL